MTSQPDTLHELRIGVAMSGAIALVLYETGVAHEIERFIHSWENDHPRSIEYNKILHQVDIRPIIDILTGASAGGINTVLLGSCVASGKPFDPFHNIWIEDAGIDKMKNSGRNNPPSLLDPKSLTNKLKTPLADYAKDAKNENLDIDLDVQICRTYILPHSESTRDAIGHNIQVETKSNVIHFDVNDFSEIEKVDTLIRAAQATSAFPLVFPPVRGDGDESNQWFTDGGLWDNQPIDLAVCAIKDKPALGITHRCILFTDPDPTTHLPDGDPNEQPGAASILSQIPFMGIKGNMWPAIKEILNYNQRIKLYDCLARDMQDGDALKALLMLGKYLILSTDNDFAEIKAAIDTGRLNFGDECDPSILNRVRIQSVLFDDNAALIQRWNAILDRFGTHEPYDQNLRSAIFTAALMGLQQINNLDLKRRWVRRQIDTINQYLSERQSSLQEIDNIAKQKNAARDTNLNLIIFQLMVYVNNAARQIIQLSNNILHSDSQPPDDPSSLIANNGVEIAKQLADVINHLNTVITAVSSIIAAKNGSHFYNQQDIKSIVESITYKDDLDSTDFNPVAVSYINGIKEKATGLIGISTQYISTAKTAYYILLQRLNEALVTCGGDKKQYHSLYSYCSDKMLSSIEEVIQTAKNEGVDPNPDTILTILQEWITDIKVTYKAHPFQIDEETDASSRSNIPIVRQYHKKYNDATYLKLHVKELTDQLIPVASSSFVLDPIDAVSIVLAGMSDLVGKKQIDLIRISPEDTNNLNLIGISRSETMPASVQKLAGEGMGHMTGFFEQRWRRNDYIWGRLDACEILLRTLVHYARSLGHHISEEEYRNRLTAVQTEILVDEAKVYTGDPGGYKQQVNAAYLWNRVGGVIQNTQASDDTISANRLLIGYGMETLADATEPPFSKNVDYLVNSTIKVLNGNVDKPPSALNILARTSRFLAFLVSILCVILPTRIRRIASDMWKLVFVSGLVLLTFFGIGWFFGKFTQALQLAGIAFWGILSAFTLLAIGCVMGFRLRWIIPLTLLGGILIGAALISTGVPMLYWAIAALGLLLLPFLLSRLDKNA